jgi:hypothetical protein
MRCTLALAAVLSVSALATTPAAADPVRIESGFMFVNDDPTQSFGLDFGFFAEGFTFVGEDTDSFDYLTGFSPSASSFLLRFSGVPDPSSNSSCPGCSYAGEFLFRFGAVTSGVASFAMSGVLMGTRPDSTLLTAELFGRGSMRVGERSVLFAFDADPAPVPEPSSFVLAAAGVAALLRRRWSSRSQT